MARYHPTLVVQKDGTRDEWVNCVAAAHSTLVDYSTRGLKKLTPLAIRTWFVNHGGSHGVGIPFGPARDAVKALRNVVMTVMWNLAWATFVAGLKAGRAFDCSVLYSAFHGTAWDGCRSFDGRHSIAICDIRYNKDLTTPRWEVLDYDPLFDGRFSWIPKGAKWIPLSLLKHAMELSSGITGSVNASATIDIVP